MGDRATFGFRDKAGSTLWLYGHWAGEGMLENLANAVATAFPRWDEFEYGSRIMISQMIGADWNQEYGWGLSFDVLESEHSIPVVDFALKEVILMDDEAESVKFRIGFDLFVEKYADYEHKQAWLKAGGFVVPRNPAPVEEEPRYTKAEWLQFLQDSV